MLEIKKKHMTQSNLLVNKLLKLYPQSQLIPMLADMFSYSRDAIYRRLKRETPFSFDEASKIIKKLRISIEPFSENLERETDNIEFAIGLDSLRVRDVVTRYYKHINETLDYYGQKRFAYNSVLMLAYNFIPSAFYLNYPELKRFILFKWLYQYDPKFSYKSISEFTVPQDVSELNAKRKLVIQGFSRSEYVLDRHVFQSMADDIMYIAHIRLIPKKDLLVLKREMLRMLSDMESIASKGVFPLTGKPVNIYISQIDFHSCYTYFKAADVEHCQIKLYLLNDIDSTDPRICQMHEQCISSLRDCSVLISNSNYMYRTSYFREQRKIIEKTFSVFIKQEEVV